MHINNTYDGQVKVYAFLGQVLSEVDSLSETHALRLWDLSSYFDQILDLLIVTLGSDFWLSEAILT